MYKRQGNSFHTFLFHEFCKKDVITIDIQKEKDAWIKTIECDGLDYIKNDTKRGIENVFCEPC